MDKRIIGLSQVTRVLIIAAVIGAMLLAVFNLVFPEVERTEVLSVTAVISVLAAIALNSAWTRRRKGRLGE